MQNYATKIAKLHISLMEKICISPFSWPSYETFPRQLKSKKVCKIYSIHLFLHGIYALAIIIKYGLSLDSLPIGEAVFALLFLAVFCTGFLFRLNFVLIDGEGTNFLTFSVIFEKKHKSANAVSRKDQAMVKILQINGILTMFLVPPLCGALMYVKPCLPPFVGFLLLKWGDKCYSGTTLGSIGLALAILLNTYLLYCIIAVAVWTIFNCGFVSNKCLESYLKEARKILQRKEKHRSNGDLDLGFHIYRQVQILGVIFNKENQALAQPTLMVAVVMATASSLYTCIKLHRYVPMPAFLILSFSMQRLLLEF